MVLSDGMVHFLKIENFFKQIYQNYLVALRAGVTTINFPLNHVRYCHSKICCLYMCSSASSLQIHVGEEIECCLNA